MIVEKAVQWALSIANDNSHGYSQSVRWGPSYDCSSFLITAFKQAGLNLQSTYTGNMYVDFLRNGFKDVTAQINRATGAGLQRGDVLLNNANHTALCIGNGQIVHARSSEGTNDTRDNSGNEIRVQPYWNYDPWDAVLRFEEEEKTERPEKMQKEANRSYFSLQYGDGLNHPMPRVKAWQLLLGEWGEEFYTEPDGEFGRDSKNKTELWQAYVGLPVNGIVDEDDWQEVINIEV